MPALQWFGRKWRTGADDFTFSSLFYCGCCAGCGVIIMARIEGGAPADGAPGGGWIPNCPSAPLTGRRAFIGLGVTDLVAAVFFAITAILSLRGSIFELSKRRWVPYSLYVNLASVITIMVLNCIGIKVFLYNGNADNCDPESMKVVFQLAFAFNLSISILFIISILITFTTVGRKTYTTSDAYEDTWWRRLRFCCCQCGSSEKRKHKEAYQGVSDIFAGLFRGYDMVPSDLMAGLMLLHGYQRQSGEAIAARVHYPPCPEGYPEKKTAQSRVVPRLTEEQVAIVEELNEYQRFYMGVYGSLLHEYMNFGYGTVLLCCFDPFMCCRTRPGKQFNPGCYCDDTALLKMMDVDMDDVLIASWRNSVFKPVYAVVYDRKTDALVIAVRGTMSLKDCVTDLVAAPEVVPLADRDEARDAEDFFVHGGMLEGARYVLRCLEYNGVLGAVLRGEYRTKRVVALGHSLGAGVATILSVLLYSEYPSLRPRLRCLSYCPPGGLLSSAVVDYSKDFVVGCFVGNDVVPRCSMHTFNTLRESMFDVMAASTLPKTLLYANCCRTHEVAEEFHPATRGEGGGVAPAAGSPEALAYRERLRTEPPGHYGVTPLLYPCARLVHFIKVVKQCRSRCCPSSLTGYTTEIYAPLFVGPEAVQVVMSAPNMGFNHFPDYVSEHLEKCVRRLRSGELDRFFSDDVPPPAESAEGKCSLTSFVPHINPHSTPSGFSPLAPPAEPIASYGAV